MQEQHIDYFFGLACGNKDVILKFFILPWKPNKFRPITNEQSYIPYQ